MRARAIGMVAALTLSLALLPGTGRALLPKVEWVPDSWGMLPFVSASTAGGKYAVVDLTRRIEPDPTVPGRFLLGNALYGLFQSVSGGGWATLSPQCLNLVRTFAPDVAQAAEDLLHLLGGCSVEGIAFDPSAALGLDLYASTFNLRLTITPSNAIITTQDTGGVYRASIPLGSFAIPTTGLIWTKLLEGVRGNAIAVKHPSSASAATIAVGRIQRANGDVGIDDNAWCRNFTGALPPGYLQCTPSLYISYDSGKTWTPKYFYSTSPQLTCPNGPSNVVSSSKLVGNLLFDPSNNNVAYAGANSGLWESTDSGQTWQLKVQNCNATPGFAATTDANPANQRLYLGLGPNLFSAPRGSGGTGTFSVLTPTPGSASVQGQILSVVIDARDHSNRTLFVSSWSVPPAGGGGAGGVYKVVDNGNGTASFTDLKASLLEPLQPVLGQSFLQYPLIFNPLWRPAVFLAQHPLAPDVLYASTVLGGVWLRSNP